MTGRSRGAGVPRLRVARRSRATWFVALLALAACTDPPLRIVYRVADGPEGQSCGIGATCSTVGMACPAVLYLRIQSPSDPLVPHVVVCTDVPLRADRDLCGIAGVDLPAVELPREPLEVQVTVWPREAVLDSQGKLDCARTQVQFDAVHGFPILPGPAFGGRAFYQPGASEVVVTLGCTNPDLVNRPECTGEARLDVAATVLDFENLPFSVSSSVGDRLTLVVGEPEEAGGSHVLSPANARQLARTAIEPIPAWGGAVDLELQRTACIQVLEDVAQATAALRCEQVRPGDRTLSIAGVRVPKATLDEVLAALGLATFPEDGMTLGIVVDPNGNPIPNVTVMTTEGTVEYLNSNRTGLSPTGRTTTSGVFVSRDAPYGTVFSVTTTPSLEMEIGGRVRGKLTVVHFDPTGIGGQ
jgi:hypothetical protein